MLDDLRELYQEMILDHSKRPRNFRVIDGAEGRAEGYNPLCGDKITIFLKLSGDRISDISFQGSGCAISTASASILTETLKGKRLTEAETLFHQFHELVTGRAARDGREVGLGKLGAFSGVSEFPVRVKCATLAWHTLRSALEGSTEVVSTE